MSYFIVYQTDASIQKYGRKQTDIFSLHTLEVQNFI